MKKAILFLALTVLTLFGKVANSQCVSTFNLQQLACDSNCTGLAIFMASGGTMPYYINFAGTGPIQFTSAWTAGNLCAGAYPVIITDNTGDTCSGSSVLVVPFSNPITITTTVVNATCPTCPDGAISVTPSGGSAPYNYQWSQGSNTPIITGLLPGVYTVNVIDANGCAELDTVIVGVGQNGYYTLGGKVYYDFNQNGALDAGEPGIGNQVVNMLSPLQSTLSNNNGTYALIAVPGTYDISYGSNMGWNLTSTPTTYNATLTGPSITNLDFGVYPVNAVGSGLSTLYSSFPRCLMSVGYYLTYQNTGYTMVNGTMSFTHDALQVVNTTSVPPDVINGNTLHFSFNALAPGSSYTVTVWLVEPAAGNIVNTSLITTASDSINFQFNDTTSLTQNVLCSYDPNDKSVVPEGYGPQHYVPMSTSELQYLIRFQNTGNDTAFTVVVTDTLDMDLDVSTLSVISSSHPMITTLKPGGVAEFRFDNILLPDSNVNEPASHGYILYRIKGNVGNPDPTVVNNTANIYFDLNAPVITNTTLTTFSDVFLSLADPDFRSDFTVYPNPFNQTATIRYKGNRTGNFNISVFDLAGRQMIQDQMNGSVYELSKGTLAPGSYLLQLTPMDGSAPTVLRITVR